ncbi:MAG: hypothetical protein IPG71_10115 [bacterium]|nr:hypothetical protein [bacterium]
MKWNQHFKSKPTGVLASLFAFAFLIFGCSSGESPTASLDQEISSDLWSPQPGDQVQPGRPIPVIIDENYWDQPGMTINPRRPVNVATPVPIDGDEGGIVRSGNHSYVIPAGAIDGTINFTMSAASAVGIAVDCGPSPLYFADGHPVRLSLSYAGTQYDTDFCIPRGIIPLDPSALQIWYDPQDGSPLILQESNRTFDADTKTISIDVDHFSRYILA